jgi:uncharacterized protein (DUF433 family)
MKQEAVDNYIVKLENGAYRIADTRVSLESVVYNYRRGDLPEMIARRFPTLTLAQVYGAIAFYLSNKEEIDEYLARLEREYEEKREKQRAQDPEFYARFDKAGKEIREKLSAGKP